MEAVLYLINQYKIKMTHNKIASNDTFMTNVPNSDYISLNDYNIQSEKGSNLELQLIKEDDCNIHKHTNHKILLRNSSTGSIDPQLNTLEMKKKMSDLQQYLDDNNLYEFN